MMSPPLYTFPIFGGMRRWFGETLFFHPSGTTWSQPKTMVYFSAHFWELYFRATPSPKISLTIDLVRLRSVTHMSHQLGATTIYSLLPLDLACPLVFHASTSVYHLAKSRKLDFAKKFFMVITWAPTRDVILLRGRKE
jgi:hypothetical protein